MPKSKMIIDKNTLNSNLISIYFMKNYISNSDKKKIEKIDAIKYIDLEELDETDNYEYGWYDHYQFDFSNDVNFKQPFIDFLRNIDDYDSLKNPIIEIINFFQVRWNNNLELEKLHGDIGEALLILKYCKLGYAQQIMNTLRLRDNDLYDFNLQKWIIEVKTSSQRSKEIKINHSQMPNITNDNLFFCVVNVKYVKKVIENNNNNNTFYNIFDIYNEIEKYISLNDILRQKLNIYQTLNIEIVNNNAIDFNDYYFSKIDCKQLQNIKLDHLKEGLKDLIYVFDVSNIYKVNDEEFVKIIQD